MFLLKNIEELATWYNNLFELSIEGHFRQDMHCLIWRNPHVVCFIYTHICSAPVQFGTFGLILL